MKRFALIMLAGLLVMASASLAWAYTDTADLSKAEVAAVERLSGLGIMVGYPDGSFRPHGSVSRAEAAKIICVYAGLSELNEAGPAFSDVPEQAWYYGWVNRAAGEGWVNGYPDGSYRPQDSINQQEAAAMLLRAADVDTAGFGWPDEYIQAAQELGMFADFILIAKAKASRLNICLMINNLLGSEEKKEEAEAEAETSGGEELVDGLYIGAVKAATERGFTLWHPGETLPLTAGLRRVPKENTLIYYSVKDGEVESWSLLLDAGQGSIMPTTALKRNAVKDGPYTWAATRTGKNVEAPVELNSAKPLVRYHSYRNITVGPNSLENRNYWLGDDCWIYEAEEGKITLGSRDSIEIGKAVTLLVNNNDEAVVLICWQ